MSRIFLFILTNLAVVFVANIILSLLGVDGYLTQNGSDLNLSALLVISFIFGFAGALISLAISKWSAKRMMGVKIISNPTSTKERWLLDTVRRQAKIVGIGNPEVGIFQSTQINAFATGARKNNALVAVSSALLDQMTEGEAEAVVGHEMSHIANGDMVTLTLIQGVVNTFVIFFARIIGHVVDRVILKNERGYGIGYYVTTIFAQIVLSILATMIVMWFSRKREFIADTGGADLAGNHNMIAALERLKMPSQAEPMPDQLAAFGIAGNSVKQLFSSHPPLDKRIEALRKRG